MKVYLPTEINPDDLPKGEVIAFNKFGLMLIGYVEKSKDGTIDCFNDQELETNITHYLREIDLPDDYRELWDSYIDDLQRFAGTDVITKRSFQKFFEDKFKQ